MENFSYHVPVYVVTGGVKLSGHSSDLNAGGVSIYDRSTYSVATSAGSGKEFFFAQGNIGGKDWYGHPVTQTTHKSPFFLGKDVENMYLSLPQTIQNEEWVIGYNGAQSSVGLQFEKGKAVRINLFFHGQPIYRFFGGVKNYTVSYTPPEDCTEPCAGSDCPETVLDPLVHTQKLVDLINTHTELQKFGVRAQIVTSPYTASTPNMKKWKLEVCDNGDSVALQQVQAQAADGITVKRTGRVGSVSTYEFCQSDAASDPADFQQSGSVQKAICSECPVGSTLAGGQDVYYVTRAITPSTDLSTTNAQNVYAGTIGAAYAAGATATIATTDVNVSTDTITETAHKFNTGDKVLYTAGGTAITGLTTATNYYVIKTGVNTFKVASSYANALAGTAIDLTGTGNNAQTFTPVITSSFVSQNGATALVKISVASGSTVTTLVADSVDFAYSTQEECVFDAPSAISWDENGTGLSSTRTMKIKALQRPDCNPSADRIADLTDILSGVKGIKINTLTKIAGDGCADDYTVQQDSLDCLDEEYCMSNSVTFTYDDLPAYESKYWEVVPPVVSENSSRKTGIRISAGYIDPKFGNCSFNILDYYETMPVKMEVSLLQEDGSRCDAANWPSQQQTKVGRISRQSGEWVVREVIMKTNAYLRHMQQFSEDPRMREAFDQNLLSMVDRNAYYKLYYVTFRASYGNYTWRKNEQEKFTAIFAFKESDPAAKVFESSVLDVLTAKSGVTLHINE